MTLQSPLSHSSNTALTGRPFLYLVDGSGFIFRAFHALPSLSRADGTPVNAVLGFSQMLVKLLVDNNAHDLAVVFDAGRQTFRQTIYPDYKANRSETPPELVPQFPLIREACAAFNVPSIELEGYEADDIIATLARLATEAGYDVVIVSSDKDLMQLVSDHVSLMDPMKNTRVGRAQVIEKFGVPPEQMCDVQALMGDSSDNIPGVPGIGPKTAAELIQQFGSLEEVLRQAATLPQASRRQRLMEHQELARVSMRLVRLVDNIPLTVGLTNFHRRDPDPAVLQAFLDQQNFLTLKRRLSGWLKALPSSVETLSPKSSASQQMDFFEAPSSGASASTVLPQSSSVSHPYTLIQDEATLAAWMREARDIGCVAIDTETTGLRLERAEWLGVSLALAPGRAAYIPLAHRDRASGAVHPDQLPRETVVQALKELCKDPSVRKIGHNMTFDLGVFLRHGIDVQAYDDTMLMSYVLFNAAHGHGMDELAARFLHRQTMTYKEALDADPPHATLATVPMERVAFYAAEDADVTLQLYQLLWPQLLRSGLMTVYERFDRPLCSIIARMERAGILVDASVLTRLSHDFAERMAVLEGQIHALAGRTFNVASPKQLGEILFDEQGLSGGKKGKTGAYSTSADVLENLAEQGHPLPQKVLDWRQLAKLKSTYADALVECMHPETHRVHTSFSLAATSTGRLSSSDPNVQNIPVRTEDGRKIRAAFMAPPDYSLVSCDYSQIELRLLAHVAKVDSLRDAFHRGLDIHTLTAAEVLGLPSVEDVTPEQRRQAKAINFGIIYGISAFGLGRQLGIPSSEAARIIERYKQQYPGIVEYMEHTKAYARTHGYVVTPWGRRCVIKGLNDRQPAVRAFAERQAINAPLQGGAADIIKKAMIVVDRLLSEHFPRARLLLQVHDELVCEVPSDEADALAAAMKAVMEKVVTLTVPLIVDTTVDHRWN